MSKRKQGRRSNGCGNVRLKGNTYYCRYTDARGVRREVPAHTSNYQEALKVLATYTEPIRKAESDEEIKLRLRQQIEVLELRKDVAKIERLRLDELAEKFLNHRNLTDATNGTKNCYKAHLTNLVNAIKAKYPDVVNVDDVTIEVADGAMNELTKTYTATAYNPAAAQVKAPAAGSASAASPTPGEGSASAAPSADSNCADGSCNVAPPAEDAQ